MRLSIVVFLFFEMIFIGCTQNVEIKKPMAVVSVMPISTTHDSIVVPSSSESMEIPGDVTLVRLVYETQSGWYHYPDRNDPETQTLQGCLEQRYDLSHYTILKYVKAGDESFLVGPDQFHIIFYAYLKWKK